MVDSRWKPALFAVAAGLLLLAGCSTTGDAAPETVTQTVTLPPSTVTAPTSESGGAITVVQPPHEGSESDAAETGSQPSADDPADTSDIDPFNTTTTQAPTTGSDLPSTTPTAVTNSEQVRAAARILGRPCDALLFASDITASGAKVGSDFIRVEDVANPDNEMTGRTKCYYGTSDLSVARPIVVSLSSYATQEAAARQLNVTVTSEREAGAQVADTDLSAGDAKIKILLRDGGLAMTQLGTVTVAIALDHGVVGTSSLKGALTGMMRAVVAHVQ